MLCAALVSAHASQQLQNIFSMPSCAVTQEARLHSCLWRAVWKEAEVLASQVTIRNPPSAPDTAGIVIDSTTDAVVQLLDVSTGEQLCIDTLVCSVVATTASPEAVHPELNCMRWLFSKPYRRLVCAPMHRLHCFSLIWVLPHGRGSASVRRRLCDGEERAGGPSSTRDKERQHHGRQLHGTRAQRPQPRPGAGRYNANQSRFELRTGSCAGGDLAKAGVQRSCLQDQVLRPEDAYMWSRLFIFARSCTAGCVVCTCVMSPEHATLLIV